MRRSQLPEVPLTLILAGLALLSAGAVGIVRAQSSDSNPPPGTDPIEVEPIDPTSMEQVFLDGLTRINGIVAADFDSDGYRDLAIIGTEGDASGRLAIFLNHQNRFDRQNRTIAVGTSASGLAASDLNHDGHIDLVVSQHDALSFVILLGLGTGSFDRSEFAPDFDFADGVNPHSHNLVVVDTNGDGIDDIVSAQSESNQIVVVSGRGDGSFAPEPLVMTATGNHPYRITAADVDGNGQVDFITPNVLSGDITICLANKTKFETITVRGLERRVSGIAEGDLNGDGQLDLVTSEDGSLSFGILLGRDGSRFERAEYDVHAGAAFQSPVIADFNLDGKNDVAAVSMRESAVGIWVASESGLANVDPTLVKLEGIDPQICATSDLDNDGYPDLVAGGWNDARVVILLSSRSQHSQHPQRP